MSHIDEEVSTICNFTKAESENLKELWELVEKEDCKQVLGLEIFNRLFDLIPESQFLFLGQTLEECKITATKPVDNHTLHFLSMFDDLLDCCYRDEKALFQAHIKKLVLAHVRKGVKVIHVRYLTTIMFLSFRKHLGDKFTIPYQRIWLKFSTNILVTLSRQVSFYDQNR